MKRFVCALLLCNLLMLEYAYSSTDCGLVIKSINVYLRPKVDSKTDSKYVSAHNIFLRQSKINYSQITLCRNCHGPEQIINSTVQRIFEELGPLSFDIGKTDVFTILISSGKNTEQNFSLYVTHADNNADVSFKCRISPETTTNNDGVISHKDGVIRIMGDMPLEKLGVREKVSRQMGPNDDVPPATFQIKILLSYETVCG